MKKEKRSPRSKILERRHRKTSKTHHRRSSEPRDRHPKHHRSRSPLPSKRKKEDQKEHESPKVTQEVISTAVQMDLCHPAQTEQDSTSLEHFVDNKEQMIQELFQVICEENLKKITPDSLKNCPLEDLKAMCLEELNRMSNAEIIYILSGKDPAFFRPARSSEEPKEQDTLSTMEEYAEEHLESGLKGKFVATLHPSPSERSKELVTSKRLSVADEQESTSSLKSEAESDSLELCATQKEIDSLIQEEILNQTGAQGLVQQNKTDLTDMEILELELRARIIRSLLRSHGMDITDEEECVQHKENVVIKEENT